MSATVGERRVDPTPQRIDIMGQSLDRVSEAEAIDTALRGAHERRGGWICPVNLDVLRQAVRDPDTGSLVRQAELAVPDGMPLLWASRVQGTPLVHRVAGSSLIHTLTAEAARRGASVFLLGGDPGVAESAARRLETANPGLVIAGTHCPPMGFERSPEAMRAIEDALAAACPDIVFVGLGFPKQERLILQVRPLLPASWWVSSGISFSFVAGDVRRAPAWVQRIGMEWVHRLVQEPRRLARRYLVDGIPFFVQVLANSARRRALRSASP